MNATRTRLLTALFLLLAGLCPAGDDIQTVGALWNDFVAALRRGDYRAAHALFSEQSREALPYAAFVREYGPLSAAREMVLLRPESQSTRLEQDWAEISCVGIHPGTGQPIRIGAAAVKNRDAWGLVAARNETRERLEALARGALRQAGRLRGDPAAGRLLAEWAERNAGGNPVFRAYRFETDGTLFRALPREPGQGLRAFHLDGWDMVQPGAVASAPVVPAAAAVPPQPAAPPPAPAVPAPRAATNGLPELTEPLFAPPFPDTLDEMPEPPPPAEENAGQPSGGKDGAKKSSREVAPVELPDLIGP